MRLSFLLHRMELTCSAMLERTLTVCVSVCGARSGSISRLPDSILLLSLSGKLLTEESACALGPAPRSLNVLPADVGAILTSMPAASMPDMSSWRGPSSTGDAAISMLAFPARCERVGCCMRHAQWLQHKVQLAP